MTVDPVKDNEAGKNSPRKVSSAENNQDFAAIIRPEVILTDDSGHLSGIQRTDKECLKLVEVA